jgi:hypothetical protein
VVVHFEGDVSVRVGQFGQEPIRGDSHEDPLTGAEAKVDREDLETFGRDESHPTDSRHRQQFEALCF